MAMGSSQTAYTSLVTPAFSPARLVSSTVVAMHSRSAANTTTSRTLTSAAREASPRAAAYTAVVAMMKAASPRGSSHRGQARKAGRATCIRLRTPTRIQSSSCAHSTRYGGCGALSRIVTEPVCPLSTPHYAPIPPSGH